MLNFEKKGKRKGSVNVVHEGFIYTKNNADSLKTRRRCHRWRDGCKGTAFIQDNHFHLNIKCQHEPEMSEVKKKKLRVKLKTLQVQLAHLSNRYMTHVTIESKIQPFVKLQWAMGERRKKIYHPHQPESWRVQKFIEREPALLHCALGKWPKSLTIFFYCFSVIWHANRWKMCQSFTLMVHLRLCRKSFTSC